MNTRIVLAKYVPDMSRMEPRNIGVFLWTKGTIHARFLENADAMFVNELDTFDRWKSYWTDIIAADSICPHRGKPVLRNDAACMDALITTQDGNYILVDCGEILESVGKRDATKAVEFLFTELVAVPPKNAGRNSSGIAISFAAQCDAVFERSGIVRNGHFKRNEPIECAVYGIERHLHPNYYFGNGKPEAIYHRANLASEQSVISGAAMIRALTDAAKIRAERCRFLVKKNVDASSAAEEGLALLNHLCGVIDYDGP